MSTETPLRPVEKELITLAMELGLIPSGQPLFFDDSAESKIEPKDPSPKKDYSQLT